MVQRQVNIKTKGATMVKKSKKSDLWFYIIIFILLATMFLWYIRQMGYLPLWIDNQPSTLIAEMDLATREKRADFKIINAHEHVQSFSNIPLILKVMEDCQMEKMILLGTSKFTFYLNPKYGFSEYDKNNEEIQIRESEDLIEMNIFDVVDFYRNELLLIAQYIHKLIAVEN